MMKALVSAALAALGASAMAGGFFGRMDCSKLNIGVYCLGGNALTEAHVKDIADCGVDFVTFVNYDPKIMDFFAKYRLGAIVIGVVPPSWGGHQVGRLEETRPLKVYDEAAAKFKDHPAVWGIDIGDEPNSLDFPYYGKVVKRVRKLFPNQFPFLNLFPNYATVAQNDGEKTTSQLGTSSYDAYISEYVRNIDLPYVCYDFYVYACDVERMHANFKSVTDACRSSKRDFWYVLQVNSSDPNKFLSANQLRYQANIALAYGAQNLLWACWQRGWWYNNVLDGEGKRTEQYDKLKTVNGELHAIGSLYKQFRTLATRRVTDKALDAAGLKAVRAADGAELVIGEMSGQSDRRKALFVVAADDPYDQNGKDHTITLTSGSRKVSVIGAAGAIPLTRGADGVRTFTLRSNAAAMIVVDGR